MGRAIVREPQVFLMDEPLSNLDAKLRVQTRTELADLQARLGVTTVYVTHDQVEAMTMGDRVAVLKDGILQQVDRPRTLYTRPANLFVASFIGSPAMNLVPSVLNDGKLSIGTLEVPLSDDVRRDLPSADTELVIGVRPEHLEIASDGVAGEVVVVEELGSEAYVHLKIAHQGDDVHIAIRSGGESDIQRGDTVTFRLNGPTHIFAAGSGERLGD